jgi:hypothetical protein
VATTSRVEVNVAKSGAAVVVPNNDVARLMYYLHCVTIGCGIDIPKDDLLNFRNYLALSVTRVDLVFKMAY